MLWSHRGPPSPCAEPRIPRLRGQTRTLLLVATLVGVAIFVVVWGVWRSIRVPPRPVTAAPPPPPPPLAPVQAPARVDVLVAVAPLPGDTAAGDSTAAILDRDLGESDWLRLLPPDSAARATALVKVIPIASGIAVALIDGRTQHLYRSETFPLLPPLPTVADDDSARRIALEARRWAIHGIADAILQWITGQVGIAQSRIAYVAQGAIHIVDEDGANDQHFTSAGDALSPAWSHDGRRLVYSTLTSAGTHLVELDLARGSVTQLKPAAGGLNITPVYSPDDQWIVFAHGDENGTILMKFRRDSAMPPKAILPRQGFDNSSPVFRPDGGRIAFVSARPKTPQIYSVNPDGTDERLETPIPPAGRSYRASPDWSPDGRTIAFEQQHGDFQLWLLTLADHTMRPLTTSGDNEDPTWAPDSRHLAFTAVHHGAKEIWTLDVATGRLRQLTHAGNARLAAWSPRLIKN